MSPSPFSHSRASHSPQHISEILPDVLAQYGLGPQTAERGEREGRGAGAVFELPVVDVTADFALPLSLS